jgi:hypothetical protein
MHCCAWCIFMFDFRVEKPVPGTKHIRFVPGTVLYYKDVTGHSVNQTFTLLRLNEPVPAVLIKEKTETPVGEAS